MNPSITSYIDFNYTFCIDLPNGKSLRVDALTQINPWETRKIIENFFLENNISLTMLEQLSIGSNPVTINNSISAPTHYGLCGSIKGLSHAQRSSLFAFFDSQDFDYHLHHSGCEGVELEVHNYLKSKSKYHIIHLHRASDSQFSKALNVGIAEWHELKPYKEVNLEIVSSSDLMLIVPNSLNRPASAPLGTWHYAELCDQLHVPYIIFWPTGQIEYHP